MLRMMTTDKQPQPGEGGADIAIHTFNVRGCREKKKKIDFSITLKIK
jgi:hypothetical protein